MPRSRRWHGPCVAVLRVMPLRPLSLALAPVVLALLACAPHRDVPPAVAPITSEPAPLTLAAAVPDATIDRGARSRLPPSEPRARNSRAPSITATPITGDTAIDVGGGRSVRVATDGRVSLGETALLPGGGSSHPRFYERARIGDDTIVVVGFAFDGSSSDPGYVAVARIDGHADRAKWVSWINPQRIDGGIDDDWQLVVADDRVVLMQNERVMALDAVTGAQAWVFSAVDPRFPDGFMAGVPIDRTTLRMLDVEAKAHRLIVTAETVPETRTITVELDLAGGKRQYVKTRRPPTPVRRLFAFVKNPRPWTGYDDPPAQPPDPPPAGFDGLSVGHAALLWSTKTGQGIVVNPTRDASADVIEAARRVRFTDSAGKESPIEWTMVIDTAAIAAAMDAKATRPPTATRSARADEIRFDYSYGFGTMQTGEVVELDTVAGALGAVAVRSYADLPAARHGVSIVRVPGQLPELHVRWGPVVFVDDPSNHVLVFVRPM